MISVVKFRFGNFKLRKEAFHIRNQVFVDEQNVPQEIEYDNYEACSIHYLALWQNKPVATARYRFTHEGIKFERFATLKKFRNKGAGTKILHTMLANLDHSSKTLYLHAQIQEVNFYSKAGFIKIGRLFYEADIKHYKMILNK